MAGVVVTVLGWSWKVMWDRLTALEDRTRTIEIFLDIEVK